MNSNEDDPDAVTIRTRLREILLDLADCEDQIAFTEAAAVPYWAPHPTSVASHRSAATCLRREADRFLDANSPVTCARVKAAAPRNGVAMKSVNSDTGSDRASPAWRAHIDNRHAS